MMFSEPENKPRPIKYFNSALELKIDDNRVYYYLGRALHNNYRFSEAQASYTDYKNIAKKRKVASFNIERRIQECKNGISLLSHIKLLYVIDKQLVKDATFYKSYNYKESSGRVIAVPTSLRTKYDKKHEAPRFGVYVPEGDILYYASYGKKGENGLDIYRAKKSMDGKWINSENLGRNINTKYDDAYPFISGDGKILYFSSKGHNSMGGYDIFKSNFMLSSFVWGKSENLNFPVNTPFDDLFYVPDTSNSMAYFSSDRQSLKGKIYVYHIGLDVNAEEQDLAKAFREGDDATDIVRLLKDIAELKTNINLEDYKKKIPKKLIEKEDKSDENIASNNKKQDEDDVLIDINDYQELENIVAESYNEYKKTNYKAIKLQRKRNSIGKIASENQAAADKLNALGDEESIKTAKSYEAAAVVSLELAVKLDSHIIATEFAAKQMLEETSMMQQYIINHDEDSVKIAYKRIISIRNKNRDLPNVINEVDEQQQALVEAKRQQAMDLFAKNQKMLDENKDLNQEIAEYEDALKNSNDEEEKQEYKEMIALMSKDVAKRVKEQEKLAEQYAKAKYQADQQELIYAKVGGVINDYTAQSEKIDKDNIQEEEVAVIDKAIEDEKVRVVNTIGDIADVKDYNNGIGNNSIADNSTNNIADNNDNNTEKNTNNIADNQSADGASLANTESENIVDTLGSEIIASNNTSDIGSDSDTVNVSNTDTSVNNNEIVGAEQSITNTDTSLIANNTDEGNLNNNEGVADNNNDSTIIASTEDNSDANNSIESNSSNENVGGESLNNNIIADNNSDANDVGTNKTTNQNNTVVNNDNSNELNINSNSEIIASANIVNKTINYSKVTGSKGQNNNAQSTESNSANGNTAGESQNANNANTTNGEAAKSANSGNQESGNTELASNNTESIEANSANGNTAGESQNANNNNNANRETANSANSGNQESENTELASNNTESTEANSANGNTAGESQNANNNNTANGEAANSANSGNQESRNTELASNNTESTEANSANGNRAGESQNANNKNTANGEAANSANSGNQESGNTELASNNAQSTESNSANGNTAGESQNANNANTTNGEAANSGNQEIGNTEQLANNDVELQKKYNTYKVKLTEQKLTLNNTIQKNDEEIKKLTTIAVTKYKLAKDKEDEANRLLSDLEQSDNPDINFVNKARLLLYESDQDKMIARMAFDYVNKAKTIQDNNSKSLNKLSEIENAYFNNINSFDTIIESNDNILAIIDSVDIEVVNIANATYDKKTNESELATVNNEISVLKEKLNSDDIVSNSEKIDEINLKIASLQSKKVDLLMEKQSYYANQIIVNDANNIGETAMISNIPSEIKVELETPTADTQVVNSLNSVQDKLIIAGIDTDSIYVPDFKSKKNIASSDKYLVPQYEKLSEIKSEKDKAISEISRSIQLSQVYFKTAEDLKENIASLENSLNTELPENDKKEIYNQIKTKKEQLVIVERKAVGGAIYTRMLANRYRQYDSLYNGLETEFKQNRESITTANNDNVSTSALNKANSVTASKSDINNYYDKLNRNIDLAKENIAEIEIEKNTKKETQSTLLQKQDRLTDELYSETSSRKIKKLNKSLANVKEQLTAVNDELSDINDEFTIENNVLLKNQNIVSVIDQHAKYLEHSTALNKSDTAVYSEIALIDNLSFNDNVFNNNAQAISINKTAQANIASNEENTSMSKAKKYFLGNSVDFIYVEDLEVARVQRMLLVRKQLLVNEEIDLLAGIDNQKYKYRIDSLKLSALELENNISSIEDVIINNGGEIDDSQLLKEDDILNRIALQKTKYLELSNILKDSSETVDASKRNNILALSDDLKLFADTMGMYHKQISELVTDNEYHRNLVVMVKMHELVNNDQLNNQAEGLYFSSKNYYNLAQQSRKSAENKNLSLEEKAQFLQQAEQYEKLAISEQRQAIKLLKTESIIANAEIKTDDNNAIDNNTVEENNAEVVADNKVNSNTKTITVDRATNIRSLQLEEILTINKDELTNTQKTDYEIKKADIVGVYVNKNIKEDFYTESNTIKVNNKMPMGLVYKVQIAAFRKPIPNNTFKGIKPISAEKVPTSAFTRYFAGLFVNYNDANSAKNNIRTIGYKDAFVVAYFNGKRISMRAARILIANGSAFTDNILASKADKLNVTNYGSSTAKQAIAESNTANSTGVLLANSNEVQNNELTYSVQIGVFGGLRSSSRLNNAPGLFYDRTTKGYYRYFSGMYNAEDNAVAARNSIRRNGFRDAFVVAFSKGKKISLRQARTMKVSPKAANTNIDVANNNSIKKVDSNINSENNNTNSGIIFKIQIGAFRSQRNSSQLAVLNGISINGLDTYNNARGLLVYTSKAYSTYSQALNAQRSIRGNGNTDVFIIAFENGKRISVKSARNRQE